MGWDVVVRWVFGWDGIVRGLVERPEALQLFISFIF